MLVTKNLNIEWNLIEEALKEILQHQQYVQGPEVEQLEHLLASWMQTRFAIGCNSGFGANLLSLFALDIGVGSRVAVPAFAPFEFVGMIMRSGATPILVDVAPNDFHIAPSALVNQLNDRIDAIAVYHLFGGAADMNAIVKAAGNIPIIEVLSYSFGTPIGARYAGTFGALSTSCLREDTAIGAYGDAAMIWTNRADLAEKIRRIRSDPNHSRTGIHEGIVSGCFHQDTIHAVMLLKKFDEWKKTLKERGLQAGSLAKAIVERDLHEITVPGFYHHHATHFVVLAERRDEIIFHLRAHGIAAEAWWPVPIHLQTGFQKLGYETGNFPEAERVAAMSLCLPLPRTHAEANQLADQLMAFYRK